MSIGDNIRRARLAKGLSQETLAARLGIRQTQVSAIERGRYVPGAQMVIRLARAIDCPTDEILMPAAQ